jgi:hypothetical protein
MMNTENNKNRDPGLGYDMGIGSIQSKKHTMFSKTELLPDD